MAQQLRWAFGGGSPEIEAVADKVFTQLPRCCSGPLALVVALCTCEDHNRRLRARQLADVLEHLVSNAQPEVGQDATAGLLRPPSTDPEAALPRAAGCLLQRAGVCHMPFNPHLRRPLAPPSRRR
jgi:hypothetical protein